MVNRLFKTVLFSFTLFQLIGCKKQPDFPLTPVITYKGVSTTNVKEGKETIVIKFSFTDGDGDLGLPQNDTSSDVRILDERVGLNMPIEYNYRLPEIATGTKNKALSGQVEITIPNTFIRPGFVVDTLTYSLRIKDRAGRFSNIITTPRISIYR